MARLPQPGGDNGSWGSVLNEYLAIAHNSNGTLKNNSVETAHIADSAVTASKLASSNTPTTGQALTFENGGLQWVSLSASGSVPDATSSVKGLVQLAGDLGGTASAPTVPGLAAKANTASVVALAGAQTVTGAKNFTGGLTVGGQQVVAANDARLTDARTPLDSSVNSAKLTDNSVTEPKLAISNSPSTSQLLSWNGSALAWATPSAPVATVAVNAQTASYTLVLADAGRAIEVNSTAAATVTIPTEASVAFPVGTIIEIAQLNTGSVTVAGAGGVTLLSADSALTLRARYSTMTIRKRGTNSWLVAGDLA
jgi:hypothetical protein